MDAGLVVGLSLGLAVLVLIILVFGCKFAKKNKEDIDVFAKEQLLGDRAVSRRKSSKSKSQEEQHNGDTDYKDIKSEQREKTKRNKSVTFYEGDPLERFQNNDTEEKRYEPRQQLFREYTECNDNNGMSRVDERSRDCEMDCFGDYRERGCKRKKNDYSSGRMKIRKSNKDDEGYDKRQKCLRVGQYNPEMEILIDKKDGVHHYPVAERNGQRRVLQHATVKQIVEDVKRNSKHNLQNGIRITVNYNTLYTDGDIDGNHLYTSKKNFNSSSGKGATQTHASKKEVRNRDGVRLLSRPQERQQQFVPQILTETRRDDYVQYEFKNATGQEPGRYREKEESYTQLSAENGPVHHIPGRQTSAAISLVHTHPQSRPAPPVSIPSDNTHQQLCPAPPVSIPLTHMHQQSRPAPPVSIPSNNTHQQLCPAPSVSIPLAHMHQQSRPAPPVSIPSNNMHQQLRPAPSVSIPLALTHQESRPPLQSAHTNPQSLPSPPVSTPSTQTQGQSRPYPPVTIPLTYTHEHLHPAPHVPEKPAGIVYKQPPLNPFDFNILTSAAPESVYTKVEPVLCPGPCDHIASVSKESLQFNDERADSISDAENSSFSEALATWVHHSETGIKIPRPSTTIPYITYSQRASTPLNSQRSMAQSSTVEPQNSKMKQNLVSYSAENSTSNTDRRVMQMKDAVSAPPTAQPPVPPIRIPQTGIHISTDYQSKHSISLTEKQPLSSKEPGDNSTHQYFLSRKTSSPGASQHSPSRKMISTEASQRSPAKRVPSPEVSQHSPSRRMPSPETSQHSPSGRMLSSEVSQHSTSRRMPLPEASQHSPSRRMPSPETSQHSSSRKMPSPETSQHVPSRRMPSPEVSQHSPSRRMPSPETSQHVPSRRMPSPEVSQHVPSRRMPSPEVSQHSPSRRMPSPKVSQHFPSRRMPSPEVSQHSPSRGMPSPEVSEYSPSRRLPSPEASKHQPLIRMISSEASQYLSARRMPEGSQHSPSEKIISSDASHRRHVQIPSPTRDKEAGLQITRSENHKSSVAMSPQRNFEENVEQSSMSSLASNFDTQVLPKVITPTYFPQPPDKKEAEEKETQPENGLQSEPPSALARLKPSPPPRPRQKPSKQYRSQRHIMFFDTSKPLNHSGPNFIDDQSSRTLERPEIINKEVVREQPMHTLFQQVDTSPAKHFEMTDLENVNDEEETWFDADFNEEKPKPEDSKETLKEYVDVLASESEFNPGQTSTPQQSTTEIPASNNERSDRSVLHSLLKKRRERIVSSSQDLSRLYTGEQDSFWDESISSIKKSVSLDGKLSQLHVEDNAEEIPVNESLCRVKSYLTEKIATVRDLRNDPDINALLSDIKARRKSSSSFNGDSCV